MNLHEIVSSAVSSLNPFQTITITPRGQYTVNEHGETSATSGTPYTVEADIQPVSSEDIKFITNYNQSTIYKSFWVSANAYGLNRPMARGGDMVTWGNKTFYVVNMPEDWYETCGWTHFVGALQLSSGGQDGNS